MVLKDQFFFMFSSKNTDNLWKKPYFQRYVLIYFIISLMCFIGYAIGYLMGEFDTIRLIFRFSLVVGFFFFWLGYILLIVSVIFMFIMDFIINLFNEIKSAFKPHEEITKLMNSE